MKKKKRNNSKLGNLVLILLFIALIVIGVFSIRYNMQKVGNAKQLGEKIINLYTNAKK